MDLDKIITHIEKLSSVEWAKLFALIPIIESTEEFIISGGFAEADPNNREFVITPIVEAKVVLDFERIMYDLGLVVPFNWSNWEKGRKLLRSRDFENQDTLTLLKLLTAIIRNNRFCDGLLAENFENSVIESVLKELQKNVTPTI